MPAVPVLSPQDSAAWDQDAERAGIQLATLMESAGRATAVVLGARYRSALGNGVLVAAGTGNNGGDGWVLARALHRAGISVWVAQLEGEPSALHQRMAALAEVEGVRRLDPSGPWPGVGLAVDAILGTGARGAPRPAAADLARRLHDLKVPLVAVDGPTGVDLDRGTTHGSAQADLSITFGGLRRGHALARDQVGDVVVVDIGHPPPRPDWPVVMTDARAASLLPPLKASAHKGTRGRVVVIGGADGMTGALRMASRSAFAAGAGLVHAAAPEASVKAVREADPDVQSVVQEFDRAPSADLLKVIDAADAVVLGPGLGRAPDRLAFVTAVLERARAAVVDADALMAFENAIPSLRALSRDTAMVLTPHPGEFRTLFPDVAPGMEVDPWGAATEAVQTVGATILLKGVPSVVVQSGKAPVTIVAGNPGLATGGSGDVLAGLVGTFLAQGLTPEHAAALGAQVLGRAADLAARRRAARTLRPWDVVAALPDLYRAWSVDGTFLDAPPVLFVMNHPERR